MIEAGGVVNRPGRVADRAGAPGLRSAEEVIVPKPGAPVVEIDIRGNTLALIQVDSDRYVAEFDGERRTIRSRLTEREVSEGGKRAIAPAGVNERAGARSSTASPQPLLTAASCSTGRHHDVVSFASISATSRFGS
jgi:hypothetical protein